MKAFQDWCREQGDDRTILFFALWILECASEATSDDIQSAIQKSYMELREFALKNS